MQNSRPRQRPEMVRENDRPIFEVIAGGVHKSNNYRQAIATFAHHVYIGESVEFRRNGELVRVYTRPM